MADVRSTVSVAPDPATTDTYIVITDPTIFPSPLAAEFNVAIGPTGVIPTPTNAEIVRIVGRTVAGWIIERQQQLSAARTILVGDDVLLIPDASTLADLSAFPGSIIVPIMGEGVAAGAVVTNEARLTKVIVPGTFTVTTYRWEVGTSSGNADVGVYSEDGSTTKTLVWSRGSHACPVAGIVSTAISAGTPATLTLQPGIYWLAQAFDNNTVQVRGTVPTYAGQGVLKGTSFPLPSTIVSPSSNTTLRSPYSILV